MPNESVDHRGLRKRRDPTPSYPLMGWRYPKPSVYWDLQTDQDGFIPNRRGDRSAVDREAAVRIWLVGGSTMAGSGASANNRTIAAFLEEILEATTEHSTCVVNAGVGGWSSQNELGFLTHELFPFHRPDAVVVMNGYNDTWRAVVAGAKFRRHENGGWISDTNYLCDPRLEAEVERAACGRQPPSVANQGVAGSIGSRFLPKRNYFLGELLSGAPANRSAPAAEFGEIDRSRTCPTTAEHRALSGQCSHECPRRQGVGGSRSLHPPAFHRLQGEANAGRTPTARRGAPQDLLRRTLACLSGRARLLLR